MAPRGVGVASDRERLKSHARLDSYGFALSRIRRERDGSREH